MRRYWMRFRRRHAEQNHTALFSVLLGVTLALLCVHMINTRLQPIVAELAEAQVNTMMQALINSAVEQTIAADSISFDDLVNMETDSDGRITAMVSDVAAVNLLRTGLVGVILEQIDGIDIHTMDIPVGLLFDSDLFSARGPAIQVRALMAEQVTAEFKTEFSQAGINQTMYRIMLEVNVPVSILLSTGTVHTEATAEVCVAETVIVGSVPETYLQMDVAGNE